MQDHLKTKLAWAITPQLRANLLLGWWHNSAHGDSASWLRDAAGNTVDNSSGGDISQAVNINSKRDTLAASDFSTSRDTRQHRMQAVSLKSRNQGQLDWELAASAHDDQKELSRAYAPVVKAQPLAGSLTDGAGTGWSSLAAKGIWRPAGVGGAHTVDVGLAPDSTQRRSRVHSTADWQAGSALAFASSFAGNTRTQSLFGQDAWQFAPGWATVLGLRAEHWAAQDGLTASAYSGAADQGNCNVAAKLCSLQHPARSATAWSPKAAISHAVDDDWVLKASTGRAVRFPTVSELYQGGVNALGQAINNNPKLWPERSQTSELSAEWTVPAASLRATLFHEDSRDALYAQLNTSTNANTVQNINHVRTTGLELAGSLAQQWTAALLNGLRLQGSLTYANSKILANSGYLLVPGDTVGKWQPRVPRWRASALATWQATPVFSVAYGVRYSGQQFSTLDNGDPNGFAYTGASPYLISDVRLRYQISRQWSAALGLDNLSNQQVWNFHPYAQRSANAELQFDL